MEEMKVTTKDPYAVMDSIIFFTGMALLAISVAVVVLRAPVPAEYINLDITAGAIATFWGYLVRME